MADKFELEPHDVGGGGGDDDLVEHNSTSRVAGDMEDNVYNQALRRLVRHAALDHDRDCSAGVGAVAPSLHQLLKDQQQHHNHHEHHRRANQGHQNSNANQNNSYNNINIDKGFDVISYNPINNMKSESADDDINDGTGSPTSEQQQQHQQHKDDTKLLISFLLMVIVGTGSKVYQKLGAIPMYNYPNSLNLLQKLSCVSVVISSTCSHCHRMQFSHHFFHSLFSLCLSLLTQIIIAQLHLCSIVLCLHSTRGCLWSTTQRYSTPCLLHEQTTFCYYGILRLRHGHIANLRGSIFARIITDIITTGGDSHFHDTVEQN